MKINVNKFRILILCFSLVLILPVIAKAGSEPAEVNKEISIVKSPDGKEWTITFHTDDLVKVMDLRAGQRIKVSGFKYRELHFLDGKRLATIPPSGIIIANVNQPLMMSYKKGGTIIIRSEG